MDPSSPRTYGVVTALAAIRAGIVPIILAGLVVGVAALVFTASGSSEYRAEAVVFPRDPGFADQAFDSPTVISSPVTSLGDTDLAEIDAVSRLTSDSLGGSIDAGEVSDRVDVSDSGTGLIYIDANAPDGAGAADLANAYARATVASRRSAQVEVIASAEEAVRASMDGLPAGSPRRRYLAGRLDELGAYRAFQTGNIEQVQEAIAPGEPEAKPLISSAIGGGIAGLLLGLAGVLLLDRIHPRLGGRKGAEDVFEAPVLASFAAGADVTASRALDSLRARLLHRHGQAPPRSILLVPLANEPAGAIARGLAEAIEAGGRRTIALDADLAQGGDGSGGGLAQVLDGSLGRSDAVVAGGGGAPDSIQSGGPRDDSATLLGRPAAADLLEELGSDYEHVVIAGASPTAAADSIPLISMADVTLVVVTDGSREAACRALTAEIDHAAGSLGGIVLIED